jgi:hypothetical protein
MEYGKIVYICRAIMVQYTFERLWYIFGFMVLYYIIILYYFMYIFGVIVVYLVGGGNAAGPGVLAVDGHHVALSMDGF